MKSAYLKDSRKMYKNNLGRFISIVLIITLGTAFFIGMNAVAPAMEKTAEDYMKESNIYDISLVSNLGYKQDEIDKISQNENIIEVQGTYSYDALTSFGEKDIVVRLISSQEEIKMNKNYLVDGRKIENKEECVISDKMQLMYDYHVGDKIKVYRKDETKIENSLELTEFEIVGIVKNPTYISGFYGNTELLTGELNGYMFVKEEVFKKEEYTTVYIKTNIDENILRFSDEYKEKLDNLLGDIDEVNQEIIKTRYDRIYSENSTLIENEEKQIKKTEEYITNKYNEIQNAQLQINQAMTNISYYVAQYYNSSNIYDSLNQKNQNIKNLYGELNKLKDEQKNIEKKYEELKPKNNKLKDEIEKVENSIEKNLYEIYSLEHEAVKFVGLSQENFELYYEYNKKKNEFQQINKEFETKKQELENSITQINEKNEKINSLQSEMYSSFNGIKYLIESIQSQELLQNTYQIEKAQKEIESIKKNLENEKIEDKIADAKTTINNKKNELNQFKMIAETTPLYKNGGFKSLSDDLKKIAIMGRIFPVMFFVIAALVTITTVTRMIEEDRKNIGTLKALGYHKEIITSRYIKYAFRSGILGTILGTIIGSLVIVQILFTSYGSLYELPELSTKFNFLYIFIALIISLISTVFFAWIVTKKALKENAAELMRPRVETTGKNILLEKIPFFWNRLDFLFKVCFRNIFRYKKRLFMTLIGIAGCTALIYAGLGLQSAINSISNKQFSDIRVVSMEVYLKEECSKDKVLEIEENIKDISYIKSFIPARQKSLTVEAREHTKDVFYISADGDKIDNYFRLKNRKSQEKLELNDEGVIITEKLAGILDVDVGEKIDVIDSETRATVKVIGITENYLYNYIYFTPNVYERIYGTEILYNEIFVNTSEIQTEQDEIELSNKLKENDNIAGTVLNKNLEKEFKTSLGSLMSIVILFLGCASLLSFTVLINLNNINIEERKRELSTIKLLGFYQKELESYVFRENIILTILGIIIGLILGMAILGIIIEAAEVETIFLVKDINYFNLIIAVIITLSFTIITNFFMKKKIKNIDMVESLKSIE